MILYSYIYHISHITFIICDKDFVLTHFMCRLVHMLALILPLLLEIWNWVFMIGMSILLFGPIISILMVASGRSEVLLYIVMVENLRSLKKFKLNLNYLFKFQPFESNINVKELNKCRGWWGTRWIHKYKINDIYPSKMSQILLHRWRPQWWVVSL